MCQDLTHISARFCAILFCGFGIICCRKAEHREKRGVLWKTENTIDERYKVAHAQGVRWASEGCTLIVLGVLGKYGLQAHQGILEIGSGEGRDARAV